MAMTMRLDIKGLAELQERLARLKVDEIMSRALAEQTEKLAQAVKDGLSTAPGSEEHDRPWRRSGNLQESIEWQVDGLEAAVGSNDPAAAPQEIGTSRTQPRPFLAPVAAGMGEQIAHAIGAKVAAALKGDTDEAKDPSAP
jgi:HK97 gp10 family phage protein